MASKAACSFGYLSRTFKTGRKQILLSSTLKEHQILKRAMSTEFLKHYAIVPNLPVPELQNTLDKYLNTVQPLLPANEFSITKQVTHNFGAPGGVGQKLQTILKSKGSSEVNWLSDWWLDAAYLSYRLPVVVHSNPGLVFPQQVFTCIEDQLVYAAKLICGSLQYKSLIDGAKIEQDFLGKSPLDMSQYTKVFNGCRIPGVKKDSLSQNPDSTFIIVLHNNHFFKMNVCEKNGNIYDDAEILAGLLKIVQRSSNPTEPVGVLTTENRNVWGSAYLKLKQDPVNNASLKAIQDSIFVLCLDNVIPDDGLPQKSHMASHILHGSGSLNNSGNRWFDKTLQLIVGRDGTSGLCYEHSPAEGPPMANLADYIVSYSQKNQLSIENAHNVQKPEPERLVFNLSKEIVDVIQSAKQNIDLLVQDIDLNSFTFNVFGKEDIKALKFSPDSFIQIAIQMAFIRIYGHPAAHYESASTRKFTNGRTETIRTCLPEIVDFAKGLLSSNTNSSANYQALKLALKAHKDYVQLAINGEGVDRHLLGLKLTAIENGMDVPSIYLDPGYSLSNNWRLSTSQVAARHNMVMCYGPVVPDGYGCCYNPRRDEINFAVSSFNSNPTTSSKQFSEALTESLVEMRNLAASNLQTNL